MNKTHASTIPGWLDSFLLESSAVFSHFDFITEFSSGTYSSLILCLSEFNESKSYRTSACTVLSTFSCSSSCSSCKKFSNLFDIFKLLRAIIWKRELDSQFVNAHDRWFNPYYSDSGNWAAGFKIWLSPSFKQQFNRASSCLFMPVLCYLLTAGSFLLNEAIFGIVTC